MFNKFSVRTRLILLSVITFASLVGLGLLGLSNMEKIKYNIERMYKGGIQDIWNLLSMRYSYSSEILMSIQKVQYHLITTSEGYEIVQQARKEIQTNWNNYLNTEVFLTNELLIQQRNLVERVQQSITKANQTLNELQNALQNGDQVRLTDFISQDLYPTIEDVLESLFLLVRLHVTDSQYDYQEALANANWLRLLTLISLIVLSGISFLLTFLIIRSITRPLEYSVENINRIAKGEINLEVEIHSEDELAHLLRAIQNMIQSTKKMSAALTSITAGDLTTEVLPRSNQDALGLSLNEMSKRLRHMIGNIQHGVNTLTSSLQEISGSLTQLSSLVSETAASVAETTTTIEELKQTSYLSSDKAKDVLTVAQETLQTVKSSEQSVTTTIDDMKQIQDRMQVISNSILKLSEKSLAIADIMNTVNELAGQSNLLAVNAAIEAAKAGEQGRSFSVVAQEIRTLAEQSKGATIQVRSLLSEIQNATNAAVLATEQGSKAVAKGVEQSKQANEAIKTLKEKMVDVSRAADQIVLSNQQQHVATEQIKVAMININEASNQHVEQLKQIETAVNGLNEVSLNLNDLVNQYKLTTGETKRKEKLDGLENPHLEYAAIHNRFS
jgi:methyl-accepting chemotaxis protein